jgi:hypothetical protein
MPENSWETPRGGEPCATTCLSAMAGRVRHWLHLPPGRHRPAGLVYHALPPTVARRLSPFVARRAAPCCSSYALQPLEIKARRENLANWHRFCPSWKAGSPEGMNAGVLLSHFLSHRTGGPVRQRPVLWHLDLVSIVGTLWQCMAQMPGSTSLPGRLLCSAPQPENTVYTCRR